jgi:beta-N-acetylhexosaminidase
LSLAFTSKVVASLTLVGASLSHAPAASQPQIAVPKLLGQRVMVSMQGTAASAGLLGQIEAGRVGSVVLYAYNIASAAQVTSLTSSLQRAARRGHNPPLLIAVDQEGGEVKRFRDGPPSLSALQIGRTGSTAVATRQGAATGRYLKSLGINMDLAPVADVATAPSAFIWQQQRAFSFSASAVSRYATAFASGLQSAGVAATGKHFPGLGSAVATPDNVRVEVRPTRRQLQSALTPFQAMISGGLDAVMLTTAGFPAYDRSRESAALSRPMVTGLLRDKLHFGGVAITDALWTPTGHGELAAGILAARAGADIMMYWGQVQGVMPSLEHALAAGTISQADALSSYERIVRLKRAIGR